MANMAELMDDRDRLGDAVRTENFGRRRLETTAGEMADVPRMFTDGGRDTGVP